MNDSRKNYYPSRVDAWMYWTIALAVVAIVGGGVSVALVEPEESATALPILVIAALAVIGLPLMFLRRTGYTLEPARLLVQSGPLKWAVPLADIHSIAPTRSPLSSPALSLDRLLITYGKDHRELMISPRDKDDFLRELERLRSQLSLLPKR